jgi:ABC-type bacteriocin/lantibiotic exporter with double-glycine peptidase domain
MNFDFLFDWAFWIVLISIALAFVIGSFVVTQQQNNVIERYRQSQERMIVYVQAKTYEDVIKALEDEGFFQQGWSIQSLEYDKEKELFIVLLKRGDNK